jgi:L-lactate dehydrogenase complex protein LldE
MGSALYSPTMPAPILPTRPTTVLYFGTCLIDLLFPKAGLAGMELIRRAGVRVIFPADQSCCGQPAYNSGYRDEARVVAARQLKALEGELPIVVPSGSCAGMMRHHYPELFADDPLHALAVSVSRRVFELTEFLVDVLALSPDDLGPPVKVAVHTSCSARRELGAADRIERLLGTLGNVTVVEQARKAECCGFGGTFAVKQPAISGAMVGDKCDALVASGADLVVSQDCGCLMNVAGALARRGDGPRCLHVAEFLWERTGGRRL